MAERKIDRYEVKGEIGRGGMATVFEAFDPRFKRKVALKVLPREFLHDPTFRGRFQREAQTIAALEHPAIVPVYDFGEDDGQPFLVMRYMAGGSLEDKLKKGPISLSEVSNILERIASALDKAHGEGVIHRDLKPGNILFDEDNNPYLADFGIAKITEATSALTGSSIIGTPAYMSPEQAKGEEAIDGRSDVYALGIIVYHILSGELPFDADTPMGLALKHITDPAPDIRKIAPQLPAGLNGVIKKSLEKNVGDRYATATAFAEGFIKATTTSYATREFDQDTVVYEDDPDPGLSAEEIEKTPAAQSLSHFEEPTIKPQSPRPSQPIPRTPPPSHPSLQQKKKSGIPLLGLGLGFGGLLIVGLVAVVAVVVFLVIPGLDDGSTPSSNPKTGDPTTDTSYLTRTAEALSQQQTEQVVFQQQTADAEQLAIDQTATSQQYAQNATATSFAATQMLFARATEVSNIRNQWINFEFHDFSENLDRWSTGDKNDDYMDGNLSIVNGQYIWEVTALQGMIYRVWDDTISYSDFYYEVFVQLLEGDAYESCYGIAFMQSQDEYYRIRICDNQEFDIYMYDSNGWTLIQEWTYTEALNPGEENKLAVFAQGNNFEFFVNDMLTTEFYDSNLTSGYIGLLVEIGDGAYGYYAFDNVLVEAP